MQLFFLLLIINTLKAPFYLFVPLSFMGFCYSTTLDWEKKNTWRGGQRQADSRTGCVKWEVRLALALWQLKQEKISGVHGCYRIIKHNSIWTGTGKIVTKIWIDRGHNYLCKCKIWVWIMICARRKKNQHLNSFGLWIRHEQLHRNHLGVDFSFLFHFAQNFVQAQILHAHI